MLNEKQIILELIETVNQKNDELLDLLSDHQQRCAPMDSPKAYSLRGNVTKLIRQMRSMRNRRRRDHTNLDKEPHVNRNA